MPVNWNDMATVAVVRNCTAFWLVVIMGSAAAADTKGQEDFESYCSSCHGIDGSGDGSASEHLSVPPPDITRILNRNGGQFPAEQLVDFLDGRQRAGAVDSREMPLWGKHFALAELDGSYKRVPQADVRARLARIVDYLRVLQR